MAFNKLLPFYLFIYEKMTYDTTLFYIVSDIRLYFSTDFSKPKSSYGLLKVNQLIEQERQQDDYSFKIDNGDFYKVLLYAIT